MQKSILYRLFRIGSIPRKTRPILEEEGIVLSDEGMGVWVEMEIFALKTFDLRGIRL